MAVVQGLSQEEIAALNQLGIQRIDHLKDQDSRLARLRLSKASKSRRQLTWDPENHHLVVWRPGPAKGDVMIRAPRWWISSEALSTDHGVIRLYKLLFESSVTP